MSAPNTPFGGSNWQEWWKPPWMTLPGTEGMAQDPTAAFASLFSMWSGSHPAITLPAGSISLLMKEAATAWAELMSQAASHQAVSLSGWQEAFAAFAKDFVWRMPTAEGGGDTDLIESLDQLLSTMDPYRGAHSAAACQVRGVHHIAVEPHARGHEMAESAGRPNRVDVQATWGADAPRG